MPWYNESAKSPPPPVDQPSYAVLVRRVRLVGVAIASAGLLWATIAVSAPLLVWSHYPNCTPAQMFEIATVKFAAGPAWILVLGLAVSLGASQIASALRAPQR